MERSLFRTSFELVRAQWQNRAQINPANEASLLGFAYKRTVGAPKLSSLRGINGQGDIVTERRWSIPFWFLTLATLIGPLWVYRKNRLRAKFGLCLTCGYNLTGNISGICPECGTAIPANANPPSSEIAG